MSDKPSDVNEDEIVDHVQRAIERSQHKQMLLSLALGKARLEYGDTKNDSADGDGFKYLSLYKTMKATEKALADHGLAWTQTHDGLYLVTTLIHIDGGMLTSKAECPLIGGREGGLEIVRQQQSKISYLKMSHLKTMLGIVGEDDDAPPAAVQGTVTERSLNASHARGELSDQVEKIRQQNQRDQQARDEAALELERQRQQDQANELQSAHASITGGIIQTQQGDTATVEIPPLTAAPKSKVGLLPTEKPVEAMMLTILRSTMKIHAISEDQVKEWIGCTTDEMTAAQATELTKHLATHNSQKTDPDGNLK